MIGRSMAFLAKPQHGTQLAELLHRVAESLREAAGCELYVVTRDAAEPDRVFVFEVWDDEESAQAALTAPAADPSAPKPADVLALLAEDPARQDLQVIGGVGLPPTQA